MKDAASAKPIQKRAVDTRNKILEAAMTMYAKQGYHGTKVDEIAAEAGVSTGIAYRYFRNKKDILVQCIGYMGGKIREITQTESARLEEFASAEDLLAHVIESFEQLHRRWYAFHEELEGLRHTDKDIKQIYDDIERRAMERLTQKLSATAGDEHLRERIYLSVSLIENYCHTVMEAESAEMDMHFLKAEVIRTVMNIMKM